MTTIINRFCIAEKIKKCCEEWFEELKASYIIVFLLQVVFSLFFIFYILIVNIETYEIIFEIFFDSKKFAIVFRWIQIIYQYYYYSSLNFETQFDIFFYFAQNNISRCFTLAFYFYRWIFAEFYDDYSSSRFLSQNYY